MRSRHLALLALLAPSMMALATWAPGPASAQDGGEHPAGDGAAGEPKGPPIEPTIRFTDRRSLIEIQLPRNWRAEKFTEDNGRLAHWVWPLEDGRVVAGLMIVKREDQMRAPLTRYMTLAQRETVDGTLSSGDGWVQSCSIEGGERAIWERFVEKNGCVWVAQFVCFKDNRPLLEKAFLPALDSFKVIGEPEADEPPDGWQEKKVKDYVLWTEVDEENLDEAESIVEGLHDMHKLAGKLLDGDAFYDAPPKVAVIQNGTLFEKMAVERTGQKPEAAAYDPLGRMLLVKWMGRNTQGFQSEFEQMAAAQIVSEHYGGNLPFWLSGGLRMYVLYGFQDGGKPQKPDDERMKRLRGQISNAKLRLDQWFTTKLQDVPDTNAAFAEVWAWHWFFRHAKYGKKYRKTYEKSLETLLATGDPAQAEAAWEGTDFEKMFEDYKKWGESLD